MRSNTASRHIDRIPLPTPAVGLALALAACAPSAPSERPTTAHAGELVFVPGGRFTMGWEGPEARFDEQPAHRVEVDGFWMSATEVTNGEFAAFVEATGYATTAERAVDWEELRKQLPPDAPRPDDAALVPGSLVFTPPDHPVDLDDFSQWWSWTPGASWRHPEGPDSDLAGREDHPVVHVSWEDAVAYTRWAGGSLPTEAQWERAARYDHDAAALVWGDALTPDGKHMANLWQGNFPHDQKNEDGFARTAPVGSFPPNSLGLHDMAGNVWEWTLDRFRPDTYRQRVAELPSADSCCVNPQGPSSTADHRNPWAEDSRVQKGGSFLCHASYCSSYRPSAKMATPPDTGLNHLGFRIVFPASDGD